VLQHEVPLQRQPCYTCSRPDTTGADEPTPTAGPVIYKQQQPTRNSIARAWVLGRHVHMRVHADESAQYRGGILQCTQSHNMLRLCREAAMYEN